MTRDRIAGGWQQLAGFMRESWGRLLANKAIVRRGQRERLLGRILHRHGVALDAPRRAALRCGGRA
jgi:uncharacterized protein YjbJ (UPF0337 family)